MAKKKLPTAYGIEQFDIDSINSKGTIYGMVTTKQYPYFGNTLIRYSNGSIAYDDPHKLNKTQKDYIKRKLYAMYPTKKL